MQKQKIKQIQVLKIIIRIQYGRRHDFADPIIPLEQSSVGYRRQNSIFWHTCTFNMWVKFASEFRNPATSRVFPQRPLDLQDEIRDTLETIF